LHRLAEAKLRDKPSEKESSYSCTISADGQPLYLFARQLASQSGVSIVVQESLENSLVSLEVRDQDIGDVIATVGRRLGTEVTRTGDLYFIGDLRPEDRGVYVTRLGDLPPDDLSQIAALLLSETGRSFVSESGVAVVADKVEVLSRVAEAFEKVKTRDRDTWLIQFHVVETSANHEEQVGAESSANFGLSVSYPGGGGAFGALDVALENVRDAGSSVLVAEPVYLVNDGQAVSYVRGQEFPVTTTTTSREGFVQTSVDYQSVGSTIEASIRSLGGDAAVLTVAIDDQRLTEENISGFPIIDGYQFRDVVDVVSGGTYLLTTFNRKESSEAERLGWSVFRRDSFSVTVSQVWCRVYRVGSKGVEADVFGEAAAGEPGRSGLSVDPGEPAADLDELTILDTFEIPPVSDLGVE